VQLLLGHKSIIMTARYAHLAAHHKRAAVELIVPRGGTGYKLANIWLPDLFALEWRESLPTASPSICMA
jgi:hypothetical protein